MDHNSAHIIRFDQIGSPEEGYLSIMESGQQIPFEIKRAFACYLTPIEVTRGGHAHHETEMVLLAMSGTIELETIDRDGTKQKFILSNPLHGVFIPRYCWHTMRYSEGAVQLVLASTRYTDSDYIRDYDEFLNDHKRRE